MNQIFHHWSKVATDSTSWDYPVCTRDTLWRQHYVGTSKEYLISYYILLQYFELVFLQLQLIQILWKLIIIWVNYEKNKKGSLFMKHRVHRQSSFSVPLANVPSFFLRWVTERLNCKSSRTLSNCVASDVVMALSRVRLLAYSSVARNARYTARVLVGNATVRYSLLLC